MIFAGRTCPSLAKGMAKYLQKKYGENFLGNISIKTFKDGEIWVKYLDNVRGATVAFVQSMISSNSIIELLIAIDAAKRASAEKIILILPYHGYARQERKQEPRVAISAKLIANIITEAGADRVITLDLHSGAIQGFYDIPLDHIFSSQTLIPYWKARNIPNLTVVATDVGGNKMGRFWAKKLGAEFVGIDKFRPKPNVAEVAFVQGDIIKNTNHLINSKKTPKNYLLRGRNILIVDDMIDTGGSFVNAVKAVKARGAKDVYGCAIQARLSGGALDRITHSPLKELIVTNTIQLKRKHKKITVVPIDELLAESLFAAFKKLSITSLYQDPDELKH